MGETCSSCSACQEKEEINTIAMEESPWIKALNEQNKGACQFLFMENQNVINENVNKNGFKAIHFCVANNNVEILNWLLALNEININAIDRDGNSALHIATQLSNIDMMQLLISNQIDINIMNKQGKKATDYATSDAKSVLNPRNIRNVIKEANKLKELKKKRISQSDQLIIYGVPVEQITAQQRQPLLQQPTGNNIATSSPSSPTLSPQSGRSVRSGTVFTTLSTPFGEQIGIEIEDIANFIKKVSDKSVLWNKFVNNKQTINQENDLYKLIYGLTFATLRRKNGKAERPESQPIKELSSKIKIKLEKDLHNQYFELSFNDFNQHFYDILIEISHDIKNEQHLLNTLPI